MGIIVLIAFVGIVIHLWVTDGPGIPLVFIGLWLAGFFGFPRLHWNGFFFLAYEAILAAILLIIGRYKETR
jgi:hypothetical protein